MGGGREGRRHPITPSRQMYSRYSRNSETIQGCFDVLTCVCLFLPCRREGGRGEKDQATRREAWPAEAEFSQLEEWRARLPKQWLRYYDVPNSAVPSPSCLGANTYDLERRP